MTEVELLAELDAKIREKHAELTGCRLAPVLSSTRRSSSEPPPATSAESELVCLIPGALYFQCLESSPSREVKSTFNVYFPAKELLYTPFFADFGPLNLGKIVRFCQTVDSALHVAPGVPGEEGDKTPQAAPTPLVSPTSPPPGQGPGSTGVVDRLRDGWSAGRPLLVCSTGHPHHRSNTVVLLGAYLVLRCRWSADDAWAPFSALSPPLLAFRDAAYSLCTYRLTVLDVVRGVWSALQSGLFDYDSFDVDKYEFDGAVEHGDINWIVPGVFLAFLGPMAEGKPLQGGGSTWSASQVAHYCHTHGVSDVIRLNKECYDARDFTDAGVRHHELFYPDGGLPPPEILRRFIRIVEHARGAVGVHCKAGLGRTGTCIGAFCMKHFGMSARSFTAWARICRPGSVLGPQQQYLERIEGEMMREGETARGGRPPPALPSLILVPSRNSGCPSPALPEGLSTPPPGCPGVEALITNQWGGAPGMDRLPPMRDPEPAPSVVHLLGKPHVQVRPHRGRLLPDPPVDLWASPPPTATSSPAPATTTVTSSSAGSTSVSPTARGPSGLSRLERERRSAERLPEGDDGGGGGAGEAGHEHHREGGIGDTRAVGLRPSLERGPTVAEAEAALGLRSDGPADELPATMTPYGASSPGGLSLAEDGAAGSSPSSPLEGGYTPPKWGSSSRSGGAMAPPGSTPTASGVHMGAAGGGGGGTSSTVTAVGGLGGGSRLADRRLASLRSPGGGRRRGSGGSPRGSPGTPGSQGSSRGSTPGPGAATPSAHVARPVVAMPRASGSGRSFDVHGGTPVAGTPVRRPLGSVSTPAMSPTQETSEGSDGSDGERPDAPIHLAPAPSSRSRSGSLGSAARRAATADASAAGGEQPTASEAGGGGGVASSLPSIGSTRSRANSRGSRASRGSRGASLLEDEPDFGGRASDAEEEPVTLPAMAGPSRSLPDETA